ncbi:MAG: TlpA family protein disulfide reductase, partial [Planctomycetota bacterium]
MSGKSPSRTRVVGLVLSVLAFLVVVPQYAQAEQFPKEWFYKVNAPTRAKLDAIVGKPMPALKLSGWVNGKAAHNIKGKILLVDFWATWCGPCIANIPHTNEIAEKYAEHGVVVLGVCTSRGQENFGKIVLKHKIKYPAAKDANSVSAKAWNVRFFPTYALVDREGIVLATGLTVTGAENAIRQLLAEEGVELKGAQPFAAEPVAAKDDFPKEWFYGLDPQRRAALNAVVGKPMPELNLTDWLDGKKPETEGKITVLDIWATWCGPCISAIPHTNELAAKYADDGVVVVGVCSSSRGQEQMERVAKKHGMAYPTAKDPGSAFARKVGLQFYPTYAVADRRGVIRAIGLVPPAVERVVKKLLEEQPAGGDVAQASTSSGTARINPAWLEGDAATRARLAGLEGKA